MIIDGKERSFVPYKGWCVDNLGQLIPDPLLQIKELPLRIVDDIDKVVNSNEISHKHILYNVLDKNGKEILSKWVRKITYVASLDIYLIEDNNVDELLEKNDYSGIIVNEYFKRCNVITKEGVLLSKEWFDDVVISTNGYLKVIRNGKQNLIDLKGNFLLNSDADFVANYNGEFAYCCRNGLLCKAFSNGREETLKHLEVCNTDLFETRYKNCNLLFKWMITKRADDVAKWNVLFMDKYQLFDKNYEQIWEADISGLFFVTNKNKTKLKDISDKTLTDFSFKLPKDSHFINGLAVIEVEGGYGLINPLGIIVCEGFSSVLWTPQKHCMWVMYSCRKGEDKLYFHGEGDEFIAWVHDFLLTNQIAYLLEKEDVWYYPDKNNNIVRLFEYHMDFT